MNLTGRAWYRSEAWKPTVITQLSSSPETDRNAGDLSSKTRGQNLFSPPSISPEFGHTSSWVLLLTSPASFPDQPRHLKRQDYRRSTTGKLADFGASIHRRHRAWRLTATTIGLTEEDPQNENQPADVVDTESGHYHCEWNIQNLFSKYMMIL
ncbi:hypothetical protein CUMW_269120 [Citrus unshiu]|uniref:Uncharacterized protein n=1 Tax=Citrus unshiu TaxID=55188 RepID=A0A2H5QWR6_CITUN|nr:hypothetical protein CUMW_269120 [Citrus unshiu]